ncbi:MAG: GNAT family N-acetyltransferase [Chloroflexota bacterium]
MNLGNPDHPVGGLAVPLPAGVELRPLARDDFAVALELARELYHLPATDAEPFRAAYDAMVNSPDASPFLALVDGEAAGMALFWFRRRLGHARFQGWLSDLYVRPAHGRRGIGSAMVRACIAEWRLRQGDSIMLEVARDNEAARRLYASLGFVETGHHLQQRPIQPRGVAPAAGIELRPMAPDDFEPVTRLLGELGVPVPAEERMATMRRVFVAHLRDPANRSRVAVRDGEVVGVCTLVLRHPFFMPRPQAWIPELVVADRARGVRIGSALLDSALATAAEADAYACVLESGPQRAVAHALYAAAGFADLGVFHVLAA